MKAKDILNTAASLVSGDRSEKHGDMGASFDGIAKWWQTYLDTRGPGPLDAEDIATMMLLLKVSRMRVGVYNPDDYVDAAGYAGCAGEVRAHRERTPTFEPYHGNDGESGRDDRP